MDLGRKHSAAYARVVLEENFARMVRMGLRSVTVTVTFLEKCKSEKIFNWGGPMIFGWMTRIIAR